jgi:hypothetical protein
VILPLPIFIEFSNNIGVNPSGLSHGKPEVFDGVIVGAGVFVTVGVFVGEKVGAGVLVTDGVFDGVTVGSGVGVGVGVTLSQLFKSTKNTCEQHPSHSILTYTPSNVPSKPNKSHVPSLIFTHDVDPVIVSEVKPVYTLQFVTPESDVILIKTPFGVILSPIHSLGDGVGDTVIAGVLVGSGVGDGVGSGVGDGVGSFDGVGVGSGVGDGVGSGVGDGKGGGFSDVQSTQFSYVVEYEFGLTPFISVNSQQYEPS